MFAKMTRSTWLKYGDKRLNALKDAIMSGDLVPDKNGKNLAIANTAANIDAISNFERSGAATFSLNLKDGTTVLSNDIGKSPLFGGKGQGSGATGATAKGESLQCLYLAAMLGEGIRKEFSHFNPELLKSYFNKIDTDKSFKEMMSSEVEWHYSAYVSAEYLIRKGYVHRNHVMHRGSKTMAEIYAMKRKAFLAEGKPMLNDDKWNPGDIWAIKKGLNVKSILDPTTITSLNASLKKAYNDRTIVGISLKQINSLNKNAKHKEYNLRSSEMGSHKYVRSILKSDRTGSSYWTFKGGYIYFDGNNRMDVRAPSSLGALNVEIQGKGARGGRAGYAAIAYAAKTILKTNLSSNTELKSRARSMMNGKNEKASKDLWKKVNKIHPDIKWDDFWLEMQSATIDRIHANLGATEIISAVDSSSQKRRDDFTSYLVNMAGSKTEDSSIYVKIEAA